MLLLTFQKEIFVELFKIEMKFPGTFFKKITLFKEFPCLLKFIITQGLFSLMSINFISVFLNPMIKYLFFSSDLYQSPSAISFSVSKSK